MYLKYHIMGTNILEIKCSGFAETCLLLYFQDLLPMCIHMTY